MGQLDEKSAQSLPTFYKTLKQLIEILNLTKPHEVTGKIRNVSQFH